MGMVVVETDYKYLYVKGLSKLIEVFEHWAGELAKSTAERNLHYDKAENLPKSML